MRYNLLAACMMHMEGYYSTQSKAYRNRNPGNLEVRGKPGVFRVYRSPVDGYTDMIQDILDNKGKTLRAFIAKYAPPNENNTSEYLDVVSTLSGIGPDEVL